MNNTTGQTPGITNTTSGAADLPEALRSIQRFEVVDCIDDKHVPAVIPKPHGPWVRYADHVTALAGQATAAQAVVQDDLITIRKPTTSAEMLWLLKLAHLVISDVDKTLEETFAPARPAAEPANGTAYAALPEGWPARFKCDSCDGDGEVGDPMYQGHFQPPERACCSDCDGKGWCHEEAAFSADDMRAFADATHAIRASHGQAPAGESLRTDALCDLSYSHGLKAGWNYCASDDLAGFERAQKIGTEALRTLKSPTAQAAESVPAPVPPPECETEAEKRAFAFGWFKALESERMKADSVQEDAARYRLLRRGQHWSVIDGIGNDLRAEALDAAVDAARKQGENHDNS